MTIEYDADIESQPYKSSRYTYILQQFRHQKEHDNIKLTFDDMGNAVKVQKSFCEYMRNHKIYDVTVIRRAEVIYLIRNTEVIQCRQS